MAAPNRTQKSVQRSPTTFSRTGTQVITDRKLRMSSPLPPLLTGEPVAGQ